MGNNGDTRSANESSERMGHSCCGCCCDTRRAVIIVDSICLALFILTLITLVVNVDAFESAAPGLVDDEDFLLIYLTLGLMIVAFILGIVGAIQFNKFMVAVAVIALVYQLIVSLLALDFITSVVSLLFLYPNIVFIKEVQENVMVKERYKLEEQSCCCV